MDSKTLHTDELREAMMNVLRTKSEEWTGGIFINNLPGDFSIQATEIWMNTLLDKGTKILEYAMGLAIMKGSRSVSEDDIISAFGVMDIGLSRLISKLNTKED